MSAFDALFDRYALMARQRPAFLMLSPALLAGVVLFPALQSWWATLLALLGGCGVALALAEFAQANGKNREQGLLDAWGGLPSIAMLRHRDSRLDARTKDRYKTFLEGRISGLRFADALTEAKEPDRADAAYGSASRWLRAQTRDKNAFALLFQQNISYGFRRNTLGLRRFGLGVALVTFLVAVGAVLYQWNTSRAIAGEVVILMLIAIAGLYFWAAVVRPPWVKIAAESYAFELLAACDTLAAEARGTNRQNGHAGARI